MKIELFGDNKKSISKRILKASSELLRKKQHRHELWLMSCYVNFKVVKKLIKKLKKEIKLTEVYLMFNFSEIFKKGPIKTKGILEDITKWCENNNTYFEYLSVSHTSLIHAKGYALIQKNKGEIHDGIVIITSGNLTENGFYGRNIEIASISKDINEIEQFVSKYDQIWDKYGKSIDNKVFKEQEYSFRYALLSSGVFLHKWNINLKQELAIKFKLTQYGKDQIKISDDLKSFVPDGVNNISLHVIDISGLPKKEIPKSFTRSYTIETYWGKWCTEQVWNKVKRHLNEGENFIKSFKNITSIKNTIRYRRKAFKIQEKLHNKGYIETNKRTKIISWVEKIRRLRNNRDKLERIFTGYAQNPLPYDYKNKNKINELFSNMLETMDISKNKSIIIKKVEKSNEEKDYSNLNLNKKEIERLDELFQKN